MSSDALPAPPPSSAGTQASLEGLFEPEPAAVATEPAASKLPEPYYQDRFITLYHGKVEDILPLLPTKSVRAVLTDPPYSKKTQSNSKGVRVKAESTVIERAPAAADAAGELALQEREGKPTKGRQRLTGVKHRAFSFKPLSPKLLALCAREFQRISTDWAVLFCDEDLVEPWKRGMKKVELPYIRQGLWIKLKGPPQVSGDRPAHWHEFILMFHPLGKKEWNGGGHCGLYLHVPVGDPDLASVKPLGLMLELVRDFTDPATRDDPMVDVLDPFAGTGTTLEACRLMGRKAIGIEQNRALCERIVKRVRQGVLDFDTDGLGTLNMPARSFRPELLRVLRGQAPEIPLDF